MFNRLLIILSLMFIPGIVFCCSCIGDPTVKDSKKLADGVFSGTIISTEHIALIDTPLLESGNYDSIPDHYPFTQYAMKHELVVEQFFKGKIKQDTLLIYTGVGGGDCGFGFDIGERYIIYGADHTYFGKVNNDIRWPGGAGIFWTHTCQRTCLWNEEEVAALED